MLANVPLLMINPVRTPPVTTASFWIVELLIQPKLSVLPLISRLDTLPYCVTLTPVTASPCALQVPFTMFSIRQSSDVGKREGSSGREGM